MAELSKADILRHLGGSAQEISADLQSFAEAAKVLSSDHPRLVDEHPLQWVGVYRRSVAASGRTLGSLVAQLGEKAFRWRRRSLDS